MNGKQKEVQCRNCGFLHGIASQGISPRDIYFDPNAIRHATNPEEIASPTTEITTYWYVSQGTQRFGRESMETFSRQRVQLSEERLITQPTQYTWNHATTMGCFRNVWSTEYGNSIKVSQVITIVEEVQKKRSCEYYYPYTPGVSALQHSDNQQIEIRSDEELASQNRLQFLAIFVSILALISSLFAPLFIQETTRTIITEPIVVIVPTMTPTATLTPVPSETAAQGTITQQP